MGDSFFRNLYHKLRASGAGPESVTGFRGQSKAEAGSLDLLSLGPQSEILIEEKGALGLLTLNRPQALNALSLDMVRLFSAALARWGARDSKVQAVAVVAQGRAFSAGGDVKAVRAAAVAAQGGAGEAALPALFFGEEYLLARQLYHFPKPIVFFLNGLAVGSLLGLAGPRLYRVATERTLFAVPHCAVGFFPDCGSAHAFNGCPGRLGYYLALTGTRLRAAEMLAARLATHYVASEQVGACIGRLEAKLTGVRSAEEADRAVSQTLSTSLDLPETGNALQNVSFIIDEHFSKPTLPGIIESLDRSGSGWARDTIRTLSGRCPVSLAVTLRHLIDSESLSFDATLDQDYVLARSMARRGDFLEGVRAVLVDKDNAPQWSPAAIAAIDPAAVAACFRPQGGGLRDL